MRYAAHPFTTRGSLREFPVYTGNSSRAASIKLNRCQGGMPAAMAVVRGTGEAATEQWKPASATQSPRAWVRFCQCVEIPPYPLSGHIAFLVSRWQGLTHVTRPYQECYLFATCICASVSDLPASPLNTRGARLRFPSPAPIYNFIMHFEWKVGCRCPSF